MVGLIGLVAIQFSKILPVFCGKSAEGGHARVKLYEVATGRDS